MLKQPALIRLQGIVKGVKTAAPADARELHESLERLQKKIEYRIKKPELPPHPKVRVERNQIVMEVRRLGTVAQRAKKGQTKSGKKQVTREGTFVVRDVSRSINMLNYYLALPGEDWPDVP